MSENTKSGFLVKEGAVWKTWKKRLFVLKNEELFYSQEQDTGRLGVIPLSSVGVIQPVEYKKKRFCFAVETPVRTYYMCAPDDASRDSWIAVLCDERDRVQERGKYALSPAAAAGAAAAAAKPAAATVAVGGTASPAASSTAGGAASDISSNSNSAGQSGAAAGGTGEGSSSGGAATALGGDRRESARRKAHELVGLTDFQLLKVIGKGSFGKVFMARKKDSGKVYALKVLRKKQILEKNELTHTITEKNVLQRLVHPFLVNLYWAFQTADKVCFVMDFINGGELFSHLQNTRCLPEPRVQFYAAEVVLGLEYLHSNGVIYRDLKPENLLITEDGHICMTDFGIAKSGLMAADDRTRTFCGTPEYLAPEVLRGEPYGKAVDWWSLGALLYEMLNGNPPFYSHNVQAMYQAIMKEDPYYPNSMSVESLDLVKALMQRNPGLRLADAKVVKIHPFFRNVDWERLLAKEVPPPYVPPVTSKEDTRMISHEFLDLKLDDLNANEDPIPEAMQKKFEVFNS